MDPRDGVLYRGAERVPLTVKVFETLRALVENHGRVVTKDELMQRVWPDTFVEEGNLTVNIFLLRKELGEATGGIKYIETVPKRGYRFVAPVGECPSKAEVAEPSARPPEGEAVSPGPAALVEAPSGLPMPPREREALPHPPTRERTSLTYRFGIAGLVSVALIALMWLIVNPSPPPPRVLHVVQLTHFGLAVGVATDGVRLFVNQVKGGRFSLVQAPVAGGEPVPFPTPFQNAELLDISPDHSELLVAGFDAPADPRLVWVLPLAGGSPRRLADVVSGSARWSPRGDTIAFEGEDGPLYLVNSDGSKVRKLTEQGGRIEDWSPDGRWLRFTRINGATGGTTIWEVQPDGTHLQPFLPERQNPAARWGEGQCCGRWTPDGKYFFFREAYSRNVGLWAMPEKTGFFDWRKPEPVEIYAAGFDILAAPAANPSGKRLFVVGQNQGHELVRYDSRLRQFLPALQGIDAGGVRWSRDGKWLAYATFTDGCLWKAKPDGSARMQLTFPPMQAFSSNWSPDGKRLAFHALPPGKPGKICLIPPESGTPEILLADESTGEDVPNWSPDGGALMFARTWLDKNGHATAYAICTLDLKTHQITKLPGSEDKGPPSWSPDGRYVAAQSDDFSKLMLFDFRTEKWTEIARAGRVNAPQWSGDSRSIIYQDTAAGEDQPIYRVSVPGGKIEEIASRKQLLRGDVSRYSLVALDHEGEPVAVVIRNNADIYALDVDLP